MWFGDKKLGGCIKNTLSDISLLFIKNLDHKLFAPPLPPPLTALFPLPPFPQIQRARKDQISSQT